MLANSLTNDTLLYSVTLTNITIKLQGNNNQMHIGTIVMHLFGEAGISRTVQPH